MSVRQKDAHRVVTAGTRSLGATIVGILVGACSGSRGHRRLRCCHINLKRLGRNDDHRSCSQRTGLCLPLLQERPTTGTVFSFVPCRQESNNLVGDEKGTLRLRSNMVLHRREEPHDMCVRDAQPLVAEQQATLGTACDQDLRNVRQCGGLDMAELGEG